MEEFFASTGWKVEFERVVIPDEADLLRGNLKDTGSADIVITTGGTGIGPRDITVDVVKPLLDKEIPGIMELIGVKYGVEKPNALISREWRELWGLLWFTLCRAALKQWKNTLPKSRKPSDTVFLC